MARDLLLRRGLLKELVAGPEAGKSPVTKDWLFCRLLRIISDPQGNPSEKTHV